MPCVPSFLSRDEASFIQRCVEQQLVVWMEGKWMCMEEGVVRTEGRMNPGKGGIQKMEEN